MGTCSVYLGIGSSFNNTYRLIEYSETQFDVYNDNSWYNDANHPRVEGMIKDLFIIENKWMVNVIIDLSISIEDFNFFRTI